MIVLTRAERAIFLSNKEERCSLWGLGWDNSSGLKVFIDESLTCFLFFRIKGVYLSNFWNEQ